MVIHRLQRNTSPAAMAKKNEVTANSAGNGGGGKPSTMMAKDTNQSGNRLMMVLLQRPGSLQAIAFTFAMFFSLNQRICQQLGLLQAMLVGCYLPVLQGDRPVGSGGDQWIVRDYDERLALGAVQLA